MMKKTILILVFTLLILPLVTSAQAQSRGIAIEAKTPQAVSPYSGGLYRALVIGNNDYRDDSKQWHDLETALNDARAVAHLLSTQYGFGDVEVLENATRRDILMALSRLAKRALPNDNILVYYAGHGFIDDDSRRGYWVPVDADGTDQTTFLRNSTIRDELNLIASRAKHTLLISDSCFSGTLLRRGNRGIIPSENSERYLKKVSAKKSVQIMAAGGEEYVDDNYRSSGHSPFTYFLLNELKTNDRDMITLSELSGNVIRAVANNVEQTPESGVLQGAGDELGEFIFIKLDVTVGGIAPENVDVQVNVLPGDGATPAVKSIQIEKSQSRPDRQAPRPHVPMPTL